MRVLRTGPFQLCSDSPTESQLARTLEVVAASPRAVDLVRVIPPPAAPYSTTSSA